MALAAPSPEALDFGARVAKAYAKLIACGIADPESGLGGRLFYAGELDEEGRALIVAANIAGAATLAASADRAAQKQAIRDGVADFLVNSLDEALRILKNQLRKRETVAVSVTMKPAAMEREMNERGVAPDLVRRDAGPASPHSALICQPNESVKPTAPVLSSGAPLRRVTRIWRCSMKLRSHVLTPTTGPLAAGCASLRAISAA